MWVLLVVAALLAGAPWAQAATLWEGPFEYRPVLRDPFTFVTTDVAPDGTQVRAWSVEAGPDGLERVVAQVDDHPAVTLGRARYVEVSVDVSPGGAAVVGWTDNRAPGLEESSIAFARPDGSFGPPARFGGRIAFNSNSAGDTAVLTTTGTAFRPAGGDLGPVVGVGGASSSITLTADGTALIEQAATAFGGLQVVARHRDGPVSAPELVVNHGTSVELTADGTGRALATLLQPRENEPGRVLATAVRAADGTWSPVATTPLSVSSPLVAPAVNPSGTAIIAVRDSGDFNTGGGGPVRVFTGSLDAPEFAGPELIDGATAGLGLSAALGADGTAAILYGDRDGGEVRVARRTGLGPFEDPEVAACSRDAGRVLTVEDGGRAILDTAAGIAWDEPGTPEAGRRTCPQRPARPDFAPRAPVLAGRPVTLDVGTLRRPGAVLDDADVAWGDGRRTGRPRPGDPPTLLRHVFEAPGRVHVDVAVRQHRATGCCPFDATAGYDVAVFARATLEVGDQRRRRVRRRGLRVRASSFSPGRPRAVVVRVRRGGRQLGRRRFRIGTTPRLVRIPLRRAATGKVRVILVQRGTARAADRARITR